MYISILFAFRLINSESPKNLRLVDFIANLTLKGK